jgi:hypothetical protein
VILGIKFRIQLLARLELYHLSHTPVRKGLFWLILLELSVHGPLPQCFEPVERQHIRIRVYDRKKLFTSCSGTKKPRAGEVAQVVEGLAGKHKALCSNPITAKKKKKFKVLQSPLWAHFQ